jgi:hypothetical protein
MTTTLHLQFGLQDCQGTVPNNFIYTSAIPPMVPSATHRHNSRGDSSIVQPGSPLRFHLDSTLSNHAMVNRFHNSPVYPYSAVTLTGGLFWLFLVFGHMSIL